MKKLILIFLVALGGCVVAPIDPGYAPSTVYYGGPAAYYPQPYYAPPVYFGFGYHYHEGRHRR